MKKTVALLIAVALLCALLTGCGNRGVSHYDEIDFRRASFPIRGGQSDFPDICVVYRQIVNDLAARGF